MKKNWVSLLFAGLELFSAGLLVLFLSTASQARMADENADNPQEVVELTPTLYILRQLDQVPPPGYLFINEPNKNQDAAIGHFIDLKGQYIDPSGNDVSNGIKDWHWKIDGVPDRAVKTYTPTVSVGQSTSVDDFSHQYINFHWIACNGPASPQPQTITLTAGGLTANATINLYQPTGVSFDPGSLATPGVTISNSYGYASGTILSFGTSAEDGMTWAGQATLPTLNCPGVLNGSGSIATIQLIHPYRSYDTGVSPSDTVYFKTSTGLVLDVHKNAVVPSYAGSEVLTAAGAQGLTQHADSPGIPCKSTDNWVSANDSFSDYLVYKPGGPNSIYVTLAKFTWSWTGKGTNGSPWTLSGAYASPTPTSQPSSELPQWSANVNSLSYTSS